MYSAPSARPCDSVAALMMRRATPAEQRLILPRPDTRQRGTPTR